ncbi:hypothetical protein, partial [Oribacterium sinus]|uniref:hypothetical protein n=1 Tax=Oribacterium sinus TaxID=237576 RepID=UPI0028EC0D12
PYVQCCERTAVSHRLLLDLKQMSKINEHEVSDISEINDFEESSYIAKRRVPQGTILHGIVWKLCYKLYYQKKTA